VYLVRVGTIIRWVDFPDPKLRKEKIKPRWFIYLGKTGVFTNPVLIHLCTTTSQCRNFEPGGRFSDHDFIKYKAGQFGFECDCVVHLAGGIYSQPEANILATTIEEKGILSENEIHRLYKLIYKSPNISVKVKNDIHDSCNREGITGLKRS
jgi:hypothetical protein